MKKIKIGMIGLGQRGSSLMRRVTEMEDTEIVALCDEYADRVEAAIKSVEERAGYTPLGMTDYHELLSIPEIEAVIISAAWEAHVELAVAAMKAGKSVGLEVGGAYSVEDCWKLVQTSEETGIPCMMLENCCYGQKEMMCLNMVKVGVMGEIVHCSGGYHHNVREEIVGGNEIRHYRLRNYINRNCDNYPTHELGPIAKLLNINRGNRMISLVSKASKSAGLHDYILREKGEDHPLAKMNFAQGDVVTTIIQCAGGETITLTLDTTLPRFYSRGLMVHGTRGFYQEDNHSLWLERDAESYGIDELSGDWSEHWNNAKTRYAEEFDHPLWKKYQKEGVRAGHGGMDWLVLRAFLESVKEKADMPIDVYDTAAWMCISALSEQSIAMGGAPVAIPDFTNGKWIKERTRTQVEMYRLDEIPKLEY